VFVRGRRWTVLSETDFPDCRALRVTGTDQFNQSIVRTLLLPFDRPRDIDSTAITVVRPRRWLRLLQRAAIEARPFGGLFPAAAGTIDIHPYQLEPALAVLRDGRTRILIADAVGLGKTIQAGLILRQLSIDQESFRALVVVPASLRDPWAAELRARLKCPPRSVPGHSRALTSVLSNSFVGRKFCGRSKRPAGIFSSSMKHTWRRQAATVPGSLRHRAVGGATGPHRRVSALAS
jgi:hypothetical protein